MECYKCKTEWLDTIETITGICPGCGINLLHSLTYKSKRLSPEHKLQYVFQSFGDDVLQHRYIISGIIENLFENDSEFGNLILVSIKLKIPESLKDMRMLKRYELLKEFFMDKASITEQEAEEILYCWHFAIGQQKIESQFFILKELVRKL
ncbi:MAG: hypothetical protein WCH34_18135 [Bacteroidota bacterium]